MTYEADEMRRYADIVQQTSNPKSKIDSSVVHWLRHGAHVSESLHALRDAKLQELHTAFGCPVFILPDRDDCDVEALKKIARESHLGKIAMLEPETKFEQKTVTAMHNPIMKYFEYDHLPEYLQKISKPFGDIAVLMNDTLPEGPEKSAGLRKLLEAKDCAVRAALG